MKRKIYLIRHGALKVPEGEHRYIGHTDYPLSEEGVTQARALHRIISDNSIEGIYASDLQRCVDTARIIAEGTGLAVKTYRELRELDMGAWEGKTIEEIKAQFPGEYESRGMDFARFRISGGESFEELSGRVMGAFSEIMEESSGNVCIVAHAGVNRALLCTLLSIPLNNVFLLDQGYGCMNILREKGEGYALRLMNFLPELDA